MLSDIFGENDETECKNSSPTGVTIITKQGSKFLDSASCKIEIMQTEGLKKWSKISPRDFSDSQVIATGDRVHSTPPFPLDNELNDKVALWAGDISSVDCQAIVHSTNESFTDKSSVSARIYSKAGPHLRAYIKDHLKVCRTGEAKISKGFNLPARFIIHAVGPKYDERYRTAAEGALHSAYSKVLQLSREHGIKTLGLPPINSIRRGYPPHEGAHMALRVVRRFLEKHKNDFDLIVFVVEDLDLGIYDHIMPLYFPRSLEEQEYSCFYLPQDVGGENGEPVIPERQIRIADKPVMGRSISATTDSFDETIDLTSGLESSVVVGKSVFAEMKPDVDRRWTCLGPATSTRANQSNSGEPREREREGRTSSGLSKRVGVDDSLIREIKRRNRYDRILRTAKKETQDFKDMDRLRFLYVAGEDRHGRPVVVILGSLLPFNGSLDLERILSYVILTLDHVINHRPFIVVYMHSLTTTCLPSMGFVRYLSETLDPRAFKNLEALYVIQPTLWCRFMFWWFTTFVASPPTIIKDKICFLGGVKCLSSLISIEQLQIPSVIMDHDFKA